MRFAKPEIQSDGQGWTAIDATSGTTPTGVHIGFDDPGSIWVDGRLAGGLQALLGAPMAAYSAPVA